MSERRKGVKKPLAVRMRMIQGWKERRAKMLGVSVDCVPPTRREVELMKNLCGKSVRHDEETPERTDDETPVNIERNESKKFPRWFFTVSPVRQNVTAGTRFQTHSLSHSLPFNKVESCRASAPIRAHPLSSNAFCY